jgi:hypothetical protein
MTFAFCKYKKVAYFRAMGNEIKSIEMKIHSINSNGIMYDTFYDRNLRLWTSYEVDVNGYQVGNAEYWNNKAEILSYLKKYGKL